MVAQNPTNEPPLLEVRDLRVEFGRQRVLSEIQLAIPRGQTVAVIGESGCGKTVLLKSLIGLIRPTRGEVLLDGRNLAALSDQELTRQRIRFGFVFQGAALFDSLTIGQNVAFPLRQHRSHSDREVQEIVLARLADVGLPRAVVTKKPAELSGGMRKRVGLARALAMNPELMLYDEPTTGLDPIMSDVINQLILRTRERYGVTSVLVTHDMHTVRRVPDRVIMLYPLARLAANENQVLFDGSPRDLEHCPDSRVRQFVTGDAGERLLELQREV